MFTLTIKAENGVYIETGFLIFWFNTDSLIKLVKAKCIHILIFNRNLRDANFFFFNSLVLSKLLFNSCIYYSLHPISFYSVELLPFQ